MANLFLLSDMKESKKDALRPPTPELGPKPEANGEPLAEAAVLEKPEVELSNLVTCSRLAQSQASLHSSSSVGSMRDDEGGAYSEFFGDYAPLLHNRQDPDNLSLQGVCPRQGQGSCSLGHGGCPRAELALGGTRECARDGWPQCPETCSPAGRVGNGWFHQFEAPDW